VSQLPVVKAEPPVMAGEVVGAVHERTLMDALFEGRAALNDAVSSHMDQGLPFIGAGESVKDAVKALSTSDAVIVTLDGKPVGVVTRQDVLQGLSD
jgi:cystathionine beta-synthase